MTSFLMVRHFNSNHKDAILDCPAFVFNTNRHLEMPSTYIYQEEDNLFFLYISYSKSENTIKLELVYMGSEKQSSNIYHQFTITSENKEFDVNFNSKPSCANEFSVVDASNMSHLINVKFKLFYQNLQFFSISENVHSPSIKDSLEKPKTSQWKLQFCYERTYDYTTEIVEFPVEYNPRCFNCKESCLFSFSDSYAVEYYYCPTRNDFLCFCCIQWLTHKNKIKEHHLYVKQSIPSTVTTRFCKWNCGENFKFSKILSHEIFCRRSPTRTQKKIVFNSFRCPYKRYCEIRSIHYNVEGHCYLVCASWFQLDNVLLKCLVFLENQVIRFEQTKLNEEYKIKCEIVTEDTFRSKIQSEWKPNVLFFYENTLTPLAKLPLSTSPSQCRAKIFLMKSE
uniref:Uncharacterized protein LOC114347310 n=1 Tax=Diabrotica virgifera virgifera TaxID=50390 RepID=A0A6P7HDI9_DIAVI